MDKYFKLPTNYLCLQRSGDLVYAYTNNYLTRDTYELDNFQYVKIATNTNNYGYNHDNCLPSDMSHLLPSSFAPSVFIAVSIFIGLLVTGLFHVFKR